MLNVFSWDRCPDCIKVKVLLGLKNIEYTTTIMTTERQSEVEKILGKVCVPAIALDNNITIDDSEEGLKLLDQHTGNNRILISKPQDKEIEKWLENFIASEIWQQLLAPRWIKLGIREFIEDPQMYKTYIENRTQESIDQWLKKTPNLINKLFNQLSVLKEFIEPINGEHISISELNLFSRLIYLTGVFGVVHSEQGMNEKFPMEVKQFIASVKRSSGIDCYGSKAV